MDFFDSAFDSIHGQSAVNENEFTSFESFPNDDSYDKNSPIFNESQAAIVNRDDVVKPLEGVAILAETINSGFQFVKKNLEVIESALEKVSDSPNKWNFNSSGKEIIKNWKRVVGESNKFLLSTIKMHRVGGSGSPSTRITAALNECFSDASINAMLMSEQRTSTFIQFADHVQDGHLATYAELMNELGSNAYIADMFIDLSKRTDLPSESTKFLSIVYKHMTELKRILSEDLNDNIRHMKTVRDRVYNLTRSPNRGRQMNVIESFEEDDLSLAEEFFPEAAVDTILAPLSKFRASINTWSKNCNIKYAQKIANDAGKKIRVYKDPKKTEDAFNEYMKSVESSILPKLNDHSSFKEIKDVCKSANSKYFKHLGESRLEGGKEYAQSALRNECKRCSESIISSAKKISRAIDDVSDTKDPNFARACSYVVTMTSKVCTSALNEINSLAEKYDAKIAKQTGLAEGFSAGYGSGYSSGYSSGHSSGFGAGVGAGMTM